jgi:hypothetical protein
VRRHSVVDEARNIKTTSIMDPNLGLDMETDYNIPIFNRFGSLSQPSTSTATETNQQNSADIAADANKNNQQVQKIKTKPIYIQNKKFNGIIEKMKSLKIQNFNLKIINGGLRLLVENVEEFKKVKNAFSLELTEFYTFDLQDEKQFKACLYGLPKFTSDEVMEFLKEKGLDPVEVKQLNIKQPRFDDDAIYIIYFKYGSTNMGELKKIRFLNYISVSWAHYNKNKNITQCRRCQQFDHGTRNCHMKPKCVKCSENHLSENCMYDDDLAKKTKELKCANCGKNHTANYSECEKRKNFIAFRHFLAEKDRLKREEKRQKHNPRKEATTTNQHNLFIGEPNLAYQYSQTLHKNAWKDNDSRKLFEKQPENDLFSAAQIMTITKEVFDKLTLGCICGVQWTPATLKLYFCTFFVMRSSWFSLTSLIRYFKLI